MISPRSTIRRISIGPRHLPDGVGKKQNLLACRLHNGSPERRQAMLLGHSLLFSIVPTAAPPPRTAQTAAAARRPPRQQPMKRHVHRIRIRVHRKQHRPRLQHPLHAAIQAVSRVVILEPRRAPRSRQRRIQPPQLPRHRRQVPLQRRLCRCKLQPPPQQPVRPAHNRVERHEAQLLARGI